MKIKVFNFNSNGKVEFTREELENLLNEVYNYGYKEGQEKSFQNTITFPRSYHSNSLGDITLTTAKTPDVTVPSTNPSNIITSENCDINSINSINSCFKDFQEALKDLNIYRGNK